MADFAFNRSGGKNYLAIDFGSEAIKAVIFRKEDKKIKFFGHSVRYLKYSDLFNGGDFSREFAKSKISSALGEIKKQDDKKIDGVFLNLPADILKAGISAGVYGIKKEKKKITDKEEKNIYQEILNEAKRDISQTFAARAGILEKDLSFLSLNIFETKIDGYETPRLSGFGGKAVEFKALGVFLPEHYLHAVKDIFNQLGLHILGIFHEIELLENIADSLGKNAIFIDVGGEVTQIFMTKDGKMEKSEDVGIGGRCFSKAISQSLGVSEEEARFLKERYSNRKLSEEGRKKIKKIISQATQDWFGGLKLKLFKDGNFLPAHILMLGGGSSLPDIGEILEGGEWDLNYFPGEDDGIKPCFASAFDPQIIILTPKLLESRVDVPERLNNPQFFVSALIALCAFKVQARGMGQ